MNGRYHSAETPEERIAVAALAAIYKYFQEHPQGVTPGKVFLAEFLKPFLDRELLTARLDELHRSREIRELQLIAELQALGKECAERIVS